ncbi:NAD-dependent epimerase/dehydratase family protein [Mycobacterium sp. M26]|uniref:NAD-dependent epimerase/dehydratase family protein n=1 Tax=Mycobacterium sp. M26 TaxID=1762962 RepID=UPI00073EC1A6|nr:NAD-dependent epimerase/dehydratase family protein [Mycobacterium sp. M26]
MRVFITGANGFIGRALARRLSEDGHQVSGVDVVADPDRDIVAGDIGSIGPWQEHVAGADAVIHTAAVVSNAVGMDAQWRVNVLGTRHVLDAAARGGAGRVVVLSSVRAFSDLSFPNNVTEDFPVRPDGDPYVDTKIAAEHVALQAHIAGDVPVTIVRPADVYGPGSRPWTILPVELIRKNTFVLPAMGRGLFSPIYIDDLVDGVLLAAHHPEAAGQIFKLSAGGVSCKEFFGHYYRMLGKRPVLLPTWLALSAAQANAFTASLRRRPTEANATSVRYLTRSGTYSNEKARRMLGFEPRVELDEGMARAQDWLQAAGLLTS